MLTGVLVIAFPVSVFSDLWQKELERRGTLSRWTGSRWTGPDSQGDGDSVNDDMSREAPVPFISGHFDVNNANRDTGGDFDDDEDISIESSVIAYSQGSIGSHGVNSNPELLVELPKKDIDAVYDHMKSIDNSQREIRNILAKLKRNT